MMCCLCSLACLFVFQAKRCLVQRNFHCRSPCPHRRAATAVHASKKVDDCAQRRPHSWSMLQACGELAHNFRCSMPSICATRTTPPHLHRLLLLRSGTKKTSCTQARTSEGGAVLTVLVLLRGLLCSCMSSDVCSSSCSRPASDSPCAERYHQHLSSAPPHTSTPYSEQPICTL